MTEANYTHEKADVQSICTHPQRTPDAAGLLSFFIDRTDFEELNDRDLHFLWEACEEASDGALALARVVSGIGCLIRQDESQTSIPQMGSFEGHDAADLLQFIANQLNVIGQMTFIGKDAAYCLRRRAQIATTKTGASRG